MERGLSVLLNVATTQKADTAREAGAADPEQLGEQLALLIDGAAARTRVLNADAFPTLSTEFHACLLPLSILTGRGLTCVDGIFGRHSRET
ncbi:hypothetical protein ACIBO5_12980 [Nonomuraea angiospora]|uniref:hypothetical protein n=1 Tax=Nonomuraea angiospora TaxID=46172 RepID=UPI0029BCD408|nr:hypothetical protein [Nonomuraea angiospora]MDX3109242.1 hypothetical protein [Nonomuraea angiospora]